MTPDPMLSGPYCPYCRNASADFRANPETFDMLDHVTACSARWVKAQEKSA